MEQAMQLLINVVTKISPLLNQAEYDLLTKELLFVSHNLSTRNLMILLYDTHEISLRYPDRLEENYFQSLIYIEKGLKILDPSLDLDR